MKTKDNFCFQFVWMNKCIKMKPLKLIVDGKRMLESEPHWVSVEREDFFIWPGRGEV